MDDDLPLRPADGTVDQALADARAIFEALPGGVVITRDGIVAFATDHAAQLLAAAPGDLPGSPLGAFLVPDDDDPGGRGRVVGGPAGRVVELVTAPTMFEGRPAEQTFLRDVTEAVRAAALQSAHDRVLDALAASAPFEDVITVLAGAVESLLPGRICFVVIVDGAPSVPLVIGASVPEHLRAAVADLGVGTDTDDVPCAVALRTGRPVVVVDVPAEPWAPALRAAFVATGLRSCWTIPVCDDGGAPLASLAVVGATAEAPSAEEQALHEHFRRLLALVVDHGRARRLVPADVAVDDLTGLFTRGHVLRLVDEALERQRSAGDAPGGAGAVAVLLVGLDDFVPLRDAVGAKASNEILRAVAALIEAVAGPDDVVARFGPSTFVVATESTSDVELDERAMALQAAIGAPFRVRGQEVMVTASVGIARSVDGHDRAAALLANADLALYQATRVGPAGQRRFDVRLRHQAARRVHLEPALARALEAGEFSVRYQPQVDLRTGVVVGAEALVRWHHPTEGVVAPDEFIPLAERNGLIVPLGAWVLEEACRQAAAWLELRPEDPPFMSVNLSARQLADPALAGRVLRALDGPALDPALLRLELTETAVMDDPASATVILRELRSLGVRLSIDDFGTGYSSLVYLKRFPVDELKIDRAFVEGVGAGADDSAIVAAVIKLADGLGVRSLAEGVERPEQAAELVRLGCHIAQGHLFSPAVEAEHFPALLLRGFADVVPAGADADAVEADAGAGPAAADLATTDGVDAAMVALVHELRTPLTMIRGFSELLLEPEAPKQAAPGVLRGVERLTRLLQGIDDVNRLDRGRVLLDVDEHKFSAIVDDVVRDARQARPSAVIDVDVPAGDELVCRVDRTRVEQILTNLVANSLHHGPSDGPVHVVCRRDETTISCAVVDHGPGLPPEAASTLFRKYARGNRRRSGSGLGLYLARGLARAHGGDVVYRRAETGGAEFRLTLPTVR